MKTIEVSVQSSVLQFQTWDIGVAISVMEKLFNATCEDFTGLMNDYAEFVCSDSLSISKGYDIGEQGLIRIELRRLS